MSDVCLALLKNVFILLLNYIYKHLCAREKNGFIFYCLFANPRKPETMLCVGVQMFSPFLYVFRKPKKMKPRGCELAGRKGRVSSHCPVPARLSS